MGARELLHELTGAGFSLAADGDKIVIRPASKLTDDLRAALRATKPELIALLTTTATTSGRYRLTKADADAAHAEPWDDAAIARFVARVSLFLRRGFNGADADADDLAERLHLRDLQGDGMALCIECQHYRRDRCSNHKQAGLTAPDVGRALVMTMQRCPGFDGAGK